VTYFFRNIQAIVSLGNTWYDSRKGAKMKITTLTQKYSKYVMVLVAGLLVGGLTMNMVHASVPDSNDTIHGCRNTITTMLRVIDSASASCGSDEAALNWDQDGVKGYGRITYNSSTNGYSLDTAHSKNVSNFYYFPGSGGDPPGAVCFTVSGTPHNVSVASQDFQGLSLKDSSGWSDSSGVGCDTYDSGANVYIAVPGFSSFFFTVF
jgi:hypothetical protein